MAPSKTVLFLAVALLGCVSCLNLLDDPSFEVDCPSTGASPTDAWTGISAVNSADQYGLASHSGACFSDFDNFGPGTAVPVTQSVQFAATDYVLSAYIRSIDAAGATVALTAPNGDIDIFTVAEVQGWIFIELPFTATAGVGTITAENTLGRAAIDDITLTCVGGTGCPSIVGDPHITGFNGEKIELVGKDKSVFNIISDRDVQINARLGAIRSNGVVLGNYMKEMGVMLRNHTILIKAGGDTIPEVASVMIDGQKVVAPFSISFKEEKLPVITIEYSVGSGKATDYGIASVDNVFSALFVTYGNQYEFEILNIENGKSNGVWVTTPRRFVDFSASVHNPTRNPEGAFGRTYRPDLSRSSSGNVQDYKLPSADIFGTDFEFNQFSA